MRETSERIKETRMTNLLMQIPCSLIWVEMLLVLHHVYTSPSNFLPPITVTTKQILPTRLEKKTERKTEAWSRATEGVTRPTVIIVA